MTTPQNNVDGLDRNQSRVRLPVTTDQTVNAGDLVTWDATNYTVTPVIGGTQAISSTNFVGMALQSNANLIYPDDSDQVGVLVLVRGCVWLNSASVTFNWFDAVTCTGDSQTVTNSGVSGSNTVGFVVLNEEPTARPHQATPAPETFVGPGRVRVALLPTHKYAAAV